MLIVLLFIELRQQLGANRELINALQVANRKQYQKKQKQKQENLNQNLESTRKMYKVLEKEARRGAFRNDGK